MTTEVKTLNDHPRIVVLKKSKRRDGSLVSGELPVY